MADRPTASTSRVGRPRTRLRSVHISTCIPVAVKPSAKSLQETQVKGKGKGKSTKKKSKAVAVVSSDSGDLEVDFPNHPPNQPLELPQKQQEPNQPVDIPAVEPGEPEEQQQPEEPNHPIDILAEEPGEPERQQQPVGTLQKEPKNPRNQIIPIHYHNNHPCQWQIIN